MIIKSYKLTIKQGNEGLEITDCEQLKGLVKGDRIGFGVKTILKEIVYGSKKEYTQIIQSPSRTVKKFLDDFVEIYIYLHASGIRG